MYFSTKTTFPVSSSANNKIEIQTNPKVPLSLSTLRLIAPLLSKEEERCVHF